MSSLVFNKTSKKLTWGAELSARPTKIRVEP